MRNDWTHRNLHEAAVWIGQVFKCGVGEVDDTAILDKVLRRPAVGDCHYDLVSYFARFDSDEKF